MSRWVRSGGEQYSQRAPARAPGLSAQQSAARDRASYLAQARQRSKATRDSYFDDDDDDDDEFGLRETAPAPADDDDGSVDPLDARGASAAVESNRADASTPRDHRCSRGDAADSRELAGTRLFRGDESRRRRGRELDIPWGRVAAPPRPRAGYSVETSRGAGAAEPSTHTPRNTGHTDIYSLIQT